jgi:DNA repair protein RecN (Recombination protein N)
MLASLTVRNLALVDRVDVAFGEGLNVITGETGAGKSILIGALGLVLGDRADKSLIRGGETSCSAEAVFQLADPAAVNALLEAQGIDACEEGQLILRRVVKASGAGQNLINGGAATLALMKEVGRLLVDMHGPHDHQSLFDAEFQLELLDGYGRHARELQGFREAYRTWRELEARKAALEGPEEGVAEQLDLLGFRIRELEEAALDPEEEPLLLREHQLLGHAQEIQALGQAACQGLLDGDGSVFDGMAHVQRALHDLAVLLPDAQAWGEEARSIAIQVQELYRSLSGVIEGIEGDPARLQWLDDRLAVLQKMKRKYGGSVEEALRTLAQARERHRDLAGRGERLQELEREIRAARQEVLERGGVLRRKRVAAAGKLARAVTGELRGLGFPQAAFEVALAEGDARPSGLDEIEFGFAPNVGEPMRPLRAIASSGEISRVMLAGKGVLAALDRIPVLVFDEIDANIGGEMAGVVGRKLAELARARQVLCITHLPQVAVCGGRHFAVRKTVEHGRTFTRVEPLGLDERVDEIARMLGGKDLTSVTRQHAREMLQAR